MAKTVIQNISFEQLSYSELEAGDRLLVDQAKQMTQSAYAPYSHFLVGAALLMSNGEIVCGSNQENAASPSGLCAERTALFAAGAQYSGHSITAMALAAFTLDRFTRCPVTPCGACRQVMLESEQRQQSPIRLILYGEDAVYIFNSVSQLLPLHFTL